MEPDSRGKYMWHWCSGSCNTVLNNETAMVFGCGHPMGPLTLLDFVGLDTTLYIADIMFEEFKTAHYAAPPLLRRLVNAGYNGKKSGRGVYDYAGK